MCNLYYVLKIANENFKEESRKNIPLFLVKLHNLLLPLLHPKKSLNFKTITNTIALSVAEPLFSKLKFIVNLMGND